MHKKRCHAKTREARKHTFCQRERNREKPVTDPKKLLLVLFFCSSLQKRVIISSLSLSLVHIITYLKSSIHNNTIIDNNDNDNTSLLPVCPPLHRHRHRHRSENQNNTNNLIKTRSIAYERLRMPFRTTNGSRLAIYTPSFRSFPVALVGYDERCLFALQRWTRWWKQRQRQQQKRRR